MEKIKSKLKGKSQKKNQGDERNGTKKKSKSNGLSVKSTENSNCEAGASCSGIGATEQQKHGSKHVHNIGEAIGASGSAQQGQSDLMMGCSVQGTFQHETSIYPSLRQPMKTSQGDVKAQAVNSNMLIPSQLDATQTTRRNLEVLPAFARIQQEEVSTDVSNRQPHLMGSNLEGSSGPHTENIPLPRQPDITETNQEPSSGLGLGAQNRPEEVGSALTRQQNGMESSQEVPRGVSHRAEVDQVANSAGLMGQLRLQDNQVTMQPQASNVQVESLQPANQSRIVEDGSQNLPINAEPAEQQPVADEQPEIEENRQQIHAQEEEAPSQEPLVSDLVCNKGLIDHISLQLNPHSPVVKNWENLASELRAPQNVVALCRRSTQHSPTELLFDTLSSSHKTENLTVNELIRKLNILSRKDAVNLLNRKIPENQRDHRVSEVVKGNDELLEELSTLLDKESRVVKNWYNLGLKLGLSREILHEIRNGNDPSCVASLFEYIYTEFPQLTVERFKEIMDEIDRKDVKDELSGIDAGIMKDQVRHQSDMMRSICYLLNKNSCGSVKGWRHFAAKLGIDHHIYKSFEKEIPEGPTKVLLEWAMNDRPNMTVEDLCKIFKNIRRYDVIETIGNAYGQSFTQAN